MEDIAYSLQEVSLSLSPLCIVSSIIYTVFNALWIRSLIVLLIGLVMFSGEDIQKQAILLADDSGQNGMHEALFRTSACTSWIHAAAP